MDVLLDAAGSSLDKPQFIQHLVEGGRQAAAVWSTNHL
jgi:hypothetical protein